VTSAKLPKVHFYPAGDVEFRPGALIVLMADARPIRNQPKNVRCALCRLHENRQLSSGSFRSISDLL